MRQRSDDRAKWGISFRIARYPGDSADQQEATEAFEIATRMRAKLLPFFALSP